MSFNSDLASDISTILDDLGEDVTIDGVTVRGWFVEAFHQVDLGEGLINTTMPQLNIATVVPAKGSEDSTVVRGGVTYTVNGPPVVTGVGLTTLYLRQVSP